MNNRVETIHSAVLDGYFRAAQGAMPATMEREWPIDMRLRLVEDMPTLEAAQAR